MNVLRAEIGLAMEGFSLDVRFSMGNEVLALLGPSGAGKSLTVASIAGLIRPDEGHVEYESERWFDGNNGVWVRPQERGVGVVFQDYALFPHLSVRANLEFGLHRTDRSERARRVNVLLAEMHLEGLERRRPNELSGGQQQRVALARALAPRPRILLLDEPFSAVDSTVRMQLINLVREIHETHRIPVVVITHAIEEAYALADRMAVLERGTVLQVGPSEEVFRRPGSRSVARIVGTRNVLHGTVRHADGESGGSTVVTDGGIELAIPHHYRPGTPVTLCLRSSRIGVDGMEKNADGSVNAIVERVLDAGDRYDLVVRPLPRGEQLKVELSVEAFMRVRPVSGSQVRLRIPAESVHTFEEESTR